MGEVGGMYLRAFNNGKLFKFKLSCLTSLLALTVYEDQSIHQEVTSPLFPSVKHLAHVQVL
jgi:hypothetical protein